MTESEWDIQRKLSGPVVRDEILPMEDEGTLVRKYQKCGNRRCKCNNGFLHGPYYWRVRYDKETRTQSWKYVGRIKD